MKKLNIIIYIIVLLSWAMTATANKTYPETSAVSEKSCALVLTDQLKDLVKYPEFAMNENIQGFVLVSFNFDEKGQLHIIAANSNDENLKKYVINKLSEVNLCDWTKNPQNVYNMRFVFMLR